MKGETLTCKMGLEEFINPNEVSEIIDSNTFMEGKWKSEVELSGFSKGINKIVMPVDMKDYRLSVLTKVEAGTTVRLHSHDEPIFRYVVDGDLTLNGRQYGPGDWVLVPRDQEYEMSTLGGYTTVAGYGMACGTDGGDDISTGA